MIYEVGGKKIFENGNNEKRYKMWGYICIINEGG